MAVAKRELGRTGLQVATLGYGAMELRGAPPRARDITEAQAETILNKVLDAGINYIDTSIDYGLSEERLGRYISHRRDEYYLASKCGCLVGAPPAPRGQRGQHVFTRDNVVVGYGQAARPPPAVVVSSKSRTDGEIYLWRKRATAVLNATRHYRSNPH
jgi:aryl-alcohol dehydrogenase-like predicted oxidoreductase